MKTTYFNELRLNAIKEMAKEGEVYSYIVETSSTDGISQRKETKLIKHPKEAVVELKQRLIACDEIGVKYEIEEHYSDRDLEVGDSHTLYEMNITHKNGDKSGVVGMVIRVK